MDFARLQRNLLYCHRCAVFLEHGMKFANKIMLYFFSLFSWKNRTSTRGAGFSILSPGHLAIVTLTP